MIRASFLSILVATLVAALLIPATASARRSVPQSFMGVSMDGSLLADEARLHSEMRGMARSGVESVRAVFAWNRAQPVPNFYHLPPSEWGNYSNVGGVPTSFKETDAIVRSAALRRHSVLPVVMRSPGWLAVRREDGGASPPRSAAPFADYLRALVARYGPSGSYWTAHPELPRSPVRYWQIWNEMNLPKQWSVQPYFAAYVSMLRASREAIRSVDPGGKIVLGAFANRSWKELERLHRAGGRRLYDIAAVNIYTRHPTGVIRVLKRVRRSMARMGDGRKPVWLTEFGWTGRSDRRRRVPWDTTMRGQAARLTATYRLLARHRRSLRLGRAYWYTWISNKRSEFRDWEARTGLRRLSGSRITSTPALTAYRRFAIRVEGCRKGSTGRCRRRR